VDLNPWLNLESRALGIGGGRQIGYTLSLHGRDHAALWSGSADAVVDLHPALAASSQAWGVCGDWQIGEAVFGAARASLWNGTAALWVDLHALLPAEFTSAAARGIWCDATTLVIAGSGFNSLTRCTEALLWTRSVTPPCIADFNRDGGIDGADVEACFFAWEGGDSTADVNADGGIDGQYVQFFFERWQAGGC
jgi:hypothetical protein